MAFTLNRAKGSKPGLKQSQTPLWKVEHIVGDDFVTVVLDIPLRVETNPVEKDILTLLERMLQKAGIISYVITSAIRDFPDEKEVKRGATNYYIEHDSKWFDEIIKPARAKGMKAEVIIAYGAALYQMTKTGTDFNVEDLIYPHFENYVYLGHGWIGDYDSFVFPQFSIMNVFCPVCMLNPMATPKIEVGGWRMNFMISVFKKIAAHQYEYPDDLTDAELKEIGTDYDTNKEQAIKETEAFLKSHFNSDVCAFDLETSGFDQWSCKIRCLTMAFDSKTGYYLEWKIFAENPYLIDLLSEMMLSCKHRVTVNGKFDIKFLWVNGLSTKVTVTEDAMTLCHVMCSGRKKGLKTQTFLWTPHGGYDHALDVYRDSLKKKGIKDPSYYDIPKPILFPYATMDAVMTVRVWLAGIKRIQKFDREHPTEKPIEHTGGHAYTAYEWYQFVMKLYPIICRMEYRGLCVDEDIIELHRGIFRNKVKEARKALAEIFDVDENYDFGSQVQLGKLLESKGWPCHGRSDRGEFATGKDQFIEWTRDGLKGVQELTNFRRANKCLTTYLGELETKVNQKTGVVSKTWSGWPQYIHHHPDNTDRIHCDFGVCATETFRMISKEPNLQNVPTHSYEGSLTKMSFTVPTVPMITFKVNENGHTYEVTQLGVISTNRGYVAAMAVDPEKDWITECEDTVLEWDEWTAKDIKPLGIETMWSKAVSDDGNQFKHIDGKNISIDIDYYNKKAGRLCYLLMTQDAASLEARVATSDTALNAGGIDKTLYDVYDPNSGYGEDLHSMTGWNTFCKSIDLQINEITDDNGKVWLCADIQDMKIKRNGQEMIVKGSEIQESDEIVDYAG